MSVIARIADALPGFLHARFRASRSPLLRGDRRAAAENMFSPAQYPTVYKDVPADIARPLAWDGRLLGGRPVTWLSWRHFSDDVIREAARVSGRKAFRISLYIFLLAIFGNGYQLFERGIKWVPYPYFAHEIGAIMPIIGYFLVNLSLCFTIILSNVSNVFVFTLFLFPSLWLFAFWRSINVWWTEASEPLRTPTRDALLVWKSKADIRSAEYRAYCRQVEDATGRLSAMPVLPVGIATGTLRARGDMEAPTRGQTVAYDGESIRNHTLCIGATGTGKTRLFMRPMFDRIMRAKWGEGHRIGAYVTDGKGTLWRDVQASVADRFDAIVVGTGAGHRGVDLLAGMSPLEVATTFKAVSGQVAGKPADEFWQESASLLVMHSAAVARILDFDHEAGDTWTDLRAYSLLGISKIATDDAVQAASCKRIIELANAPKGEISADLYNRVTEHFDSVTWLVSTWQTMAIETRSGIVANVNVVLGKLSGAGELSTRFFRGTYGDCVDVDHALDGGVLMIAVGETDWGLAGKVVNVWLKTRLYVAARKRLISDPAACANTSCALFADEFQMLVTSGPDSDTTFWNVARETGVFLVAATQSIAALRQVLGEDQTANVVNLLRSKVILKTEELSTLEYARSLAGELPRGWEVDPEFFATQGARELAFPDVTPPLPTAKGFLPCFARLSTQTMRSAAKFDPRFIMRSVLNADNTSAVSSQQQAYWRQEDKEKDALSSNLEWRPKIEQDELLLGSGFAFAIIQRAGGDRADIIDLGA